MSANVFEHLHKRNARLAKFLDRNHNVASTFMRLAIHFEQFAKEKGYKLETVAFENMTSPDGRHVHIRIRGAVKD